VSPAGLAVAVGEGKVEEGSQCTAVSFEIRMSVRLPGRPFDTPTQASKV
jgi:hypothetical protein